MLKSAKVPTEFEPLFLRAQEYVDKYFRDKCEDPTKGTIEVFGERYIFVRAASMSVEFFEVVRNLYHDVRQDEANAVARELLFDIAHAIGVADARAFHEKMDLREPIERLSAGPIHFAYSGWAFVDIFAESRPTPDENFFLVYDHPYSFESHAWISSGKSIDVPVCIMNAGYSSGWCEESFGVTLVASELLCKAKGDACCRFVMAHPDHIEDEIDAYRAREPSIGTNVTSVHIPGFFSRKRTEESLRLAYDELESKDVARSEELLQANQALREEIVERQKVAKALRQRAEMERVVAEASKRFINVDDESFDAAVNETLEAIGRFAGADRAYLFQLREGGLIKDNTHEWCVEGVVSQRASLQGLPVDDYLFWMDPLRRLESVYIPRVSELPLSAQKEREHLEAQAVRSLVLVPMEWGDGLSGFLGFDAVREAREWREEDMTLLSTVGDVLVTAIQRRHTEAALRDAEITLRQFQKMEAVGQLAGGVAHDFNNLLSVIETNAGFLQRGLPASHSRQADVREIIGAADRAANLTRQLLAFGRRQVLRPRKLNINDIVNSTETMLRRLIGEDVKLEAHLDQTLQPIMADPGQLEQVIINLAVNGRDAMPQGGSIHIETANVDAEGKRWSGTTPSPPGLMVMLSISDTGIGMDEETKSRIFEPFFTTKEVGKGTGLGLATVYGIVMQSCGDLLVESEPGRGSTFKVLFPPVEVSPVITPAPESISIAAKTTDAGREIVLVVEDEDAVRRAATRILVHLGYEVIDARGGEEALKLAESSKSPAHLLLSDVVMPGMSGPEVYQRLQVMWPSLKVLYMSGYPNDTIVHHGVLEPGIPLVEKPFSAERLAAGVRAALDLPGSDRSS